MSRSTPTAIRSALTAALTAALLTALALIAAPAPASAGSTDATAVEAEQVAWDPAWERFAGLYGREGRGRTRVLVMNERLVMMNPGDSYVVRVR